MTVSELYIALGKEIDNGRGDYEVEAGTEYSTEWGNYDILVRSENLEVDDNNQFVYINGSSY